MVRKLLCGALLLVGGLAGIGCDGLGQTYAERQHRLAVTLDQDMRGLADDLDMIAQTDHPTRLTSVHQR